MIFIYFTPKLKEMLAKLKQSISKNMSKAVLKQEITGQKSQMAYYEKIPQSGVYLKPAVMLTLTYPYLCYT